MPFAEIGGSRIHFEDSGGTGLPLVLSHGLLMDCSMFRHQVSRFAPVHRVITWCARCHGETESSLEPFSYWDSAEDMHGLLEHLGIRRAVIGGMSQGGFVALRYALNHPDQVAALVLIDTQAGPEDPEKAGTYSVMLDVWEEDGLPDQMAETVAAIILGNEWEGRGEWIEKWRAWPRERLRPAFNALVDREDIHDRLGEIKAPALVIHGTADAAIEMEFAERLSSGLAGSHGLVQVEGGGHASNLTHPTQVNEAIGAFLEKVVPAGAEV